MTIYYLSWLCGFIWLSRWCLWDHPGSSGGSACCPVWVLASGAGVRWPMAGSSAELSAWVPQFSVQAPRVTWAPTIWGQDSKKDHNQHLKAEAEGPASLHGACVFLEGQYATSMPGSWIGKDEVGGCLRPSASMLCLTRLDSEFFKAGRTLPECTGGTQKAWAALEFSDSKVRHHCN